MLKETHIHELTGTFLEAQKESILEELSQGPGFSGSLIPFHRRLLDLAIASAGGPSPPDHLPKVSRVVAGFTGDTRALFPGQIALWSAIHRKIRETPGPHANLTVLHSVLALAGDTVDAITGILIDACESGPSPDTSATLPRWATLAELGRRHREFQMLHQIIHDLLQTRDSKQMFTILERGILGTFHLRSLAIVFINRAEGYLEVVRAQPFDPVTGNPVGWRYDLSHPEIFCDVARTGQVEVIDGWDSRYHERSVEADGRVAFRPRPPNYNEGQTAYFVPILAGDRAVGVLATGSLQADKPLILREIERMSPFLQQAGATFSIVSEMMERQRAEQLAELSQELQETNRRLEEANRQIRESTRLKSQFLSNLSHELRTPMNAIVGFTNLVLRKGGESIPERHRENLVKVKQSADHLLGLINEALDFSRMESGNLTVRPQRFGVRDAIDSCNAMVTPLVKPGVSLNSDVPDDLEEAYTDEVRIRQIVIHLLSNALKHTEKGEVRVTVHRLPSTVAGSIQATTDDGPTPPTIQRIVPPSWTTEGQILEIAVSDTGVGIPAEALDGIFEEFHPVEGGPWQQNGIGLGLSMARRLAELLGGTIRVESKKGEGSTFTLTVPMAYSKEG